MMVDDPAPILCPNCAAGIRLSRRFSGVAARCSACGFIRAMPRRVKAWSDAGGVPDLPTDRYRVEAVLHSGGHARVYLARHRLLDEPCVVKVLGPGDTGYSAQACEHLAQEARIGFRISHPGVVRVLDVFQSRDTWYVVMEYADGADLAAALAACGRFVWMQAAEIGARAAAALAAVHQAGMIHRDLKPANLLLLPDGTVKIADLGLARSVDEPPESGDAGRSLVGTPGYVPPEQGEAGRLSERADIYALGATLYHLLSGQPPQRNKSPLAYLCGEQHEPIVWPHDIAPPVPDWFRQTVETCLAQRSDLRVESAAALRDVLVEHTERSGARRRPAIRTHATRSPRIAVLPLANRGEASEDDWVGDALADLVSQRIVELQDVHLIDRHELGVLIERLCSCTPVKASDDQVCDVADLAGASTVIRGEFRLEGGTATVDAYALRLADRLADPVLHEVGPLARILGFEIDLGETLIRALGYGDMPRASGRTFAKGTTNTRCQKLYAEAQRAFAHGDYGQAIERARSALDADPGFVDLIGFIGVCYARHGQYDEAIRHYKRLKDIADEANDPYRLAEAVSNMGVMHYFKGEYSAAHDLLTVANRLEQELNLLPILSKNYSNLGFVLTKLERLEEADEAFCDAIAIMTELGTAASLVSPFNGRGEVALQRGCYQDAAEHYRTALEWATRIEDQVNVGVCHINLGRCACYLGDLDGAQRFFDTALENLRPTTFWHGLALAYEHMAELHLLRNRIDEGLACIEQRTQLAQRYKNDRIESACWEQKARAYELLGQTETAVDCLRKSFEIARRPVPAGDLYEYLEAVARRLPYEQRKKER